jgi:hypothetical protein
MSIQPKTSQSFQEVLKEVQNELKQKEQMKKTTNKDRKKLLWS